jgi:hypothetical protein
MSCKKHELLTLREHLDSHPVFGGVCVAQPFTFRCYVVFLFVCFVFVLFLFCIVCSHPASCVLNVAFVSGLSILDCPFLIVYS